MKAHNFFAGPSIISEYALDRTSEAVKNFANTGLSVMEISHRSSQFVEVIESARSKVKSLLNVPDGYSVLFLQGGASLQFLMVAYNLYKRKASYLDTGVWSKKAIEAASFFGAPNVVASSADKTYSYIPEFKADGDEDYLHITTNNTIYGTRLQKDPEINVPLVADMSSDIFSRPVDVSKYDLIYAGAQKNIGPSGTTLVIVRDTALTKSENDIPKILDYRTHIKGESMYNTPATLPIFTCLQTLTWLENLGGIPAIMKINDKKANLLYDEIDRNILFKCPVPNPAHRSNMNVCFVMNEEYKDKEAEFITFAKEYGCLGLKGHRSVGGFRASIYNAMPYESVAVLVQCMKDFETQNK
ncbi:MAG: 3-phosphoserine/phosphohydroxythreonine transaminase [Bacteroidales bacterium]